MNGLVGFWGATCFVLVPSCTHAHTPLLSVTLTHTTYAFCMHTYQHLACQQVATGIRESAKGDSWSGPCVPSIVVASEPFWSSRGQTDAATKFEPSKNKRQARMITALYALSTGFISAYIVRPQANIYI